MYVEHRCTFHFYYCGKLSTFSSLSMFVPTIMSTIVSLNNSNQNKNILFNHVPWWQRLFCIHYTDTHTYVCVIVCLLIILHEYGCIRIQLPRVQIHANTLTHSQWSAIMCGIRKLLQYQYIVSWPTYFIQSTHSHAALRITIIFFPPLLLLCLQFIFQLFLKFYLSQLTLYSKLDETKLLLL